ncbi:MAG: dihydroxyacetone kinase subunit DhaK [Lachnospiraceae bacterium]|nr:dihydroxyacetone kinase subunit DhaK [Lachnospiraceae bacterium]
MNNKAKKIINAQEDIVKQTIAGYCRFQQDRIHQIPGTQVIVRNNLDKGKVGIVMGYGAGHEPDAIGYMGSNYMDAQAIGGLFAAPGPQPIYEALKACDTGAGSLILISNCAGDVLNAKLALEMCEDDDINAKGILLGGTNVADPDTGKRMDRRMGVALHETKMICGYAGLGHTLDEVIAFGDMVIDNVRSITTGIRPGTSPSTGDVMYELADNEITLGAGGHGEAGAVNIPMCTSRELAEYLLDMIIKDKPFVPGDELSFIVNGTGGTTMMELLIFYNDCWDILEERGFKVFKPIVGTLSTIQESSGIVLDVCRMANDDMKKTWTMPTDCTAFPRTW